MNEKPQVIIIMKKAPSLIHINSILNGNRVTRYDPASDKWIEARPEGYFSFWNRIKLAFGVLIGRYDALKWGGGQ